jgi:hypothetical protein
MVTSLYDECTLGWLRQSGWALSAIVRRDSSSDGKWGHCLLSRPMTLKERISGPEIAPKSIKTLQKGARNHTFKIILNTILAKLFIMVYRIFSRALLICLLGVSLPARADLKGGWQFDSLTSTPAAPTSDGQQVYEVLLQMLDRWNAHDIEGHLEVYWKSPELLVVIDSEQFNGWQQLHDSYINGYPDRNSMGYINPARIQVKLLKPDLALALTWWTITFPNSKQKVVGNTTMNLQKFDDGWKVVAAHSSTAEM